MTTVWAFIGHPLDQLVMMTNHLGLYAYLVLFLLIFLESGMLLFSFIPGQSLLFAFGSIAAAPHSQLDIGLLILNFTVAATLGSVLKYWTTYRFGRRMQEIAHVAGPELRATERQFDQHRDTTLLIARFIPFVGLFIPMVAGTEKMSWRRFRVDNLAGSFLWVVSCCLIGYWFGNTPLIRHYFTWLVLAVMILPGALRRGWQFLAKSVKV